MPKENGPDKPERLRLEQVVGKEAHYLETRRRLANQAPDAAATPIAPSRRPIGLAFSGGGIRSATFNLGVLQALSQHRILPHVDYLSTVSGGGYIGSCFSSILSRRQPPPGGWANEPPWKKDPLAPYLIGASPETAAAFGTRPENFPFNTTPGQRPDRAGLDGRRQVRHLRTHGDFIIARKMVLSRDMLRAVGSVLGGLFYHLLLFALFMLAASGVYFTLVCLMVGDLRKTIDPFTFGAYLRALVDAAGIDWGPAHPLVAGFVVGLVMTLLSIAATRAILRRLPDRLFEVEGLSVDDRRDALALWIQAIVTLLTASIATGWFVHRAFGQGGLRPVLLAVPLAVYVGGQAAGLLLHAVVATLDRFGRNDRSRFAAIKGILNYLSAVSVLIVLLPYLVYAIAAYDGGLSLSGGWLLSAIGSAFLVRGGGGKPNPMAGAGDWMKRLLTTSAAIRNALLAVLVVVLLVGGVVLVSGLIVKAADAAGTTPLAAALALAGAAGALFVLAGYLLDFNDLSLHYFYRDRLAEAYLQTYAPLAEPPDKTPEIELRDDAEMRLTHLHGHPDTAGRAADEECVTVAPLHLLVTSLNLTSSRDMTRRDRKSDQFVFSKLHCGSQTTGFLPTSWYRGGRTLLARAMTISGAAASPAMGRGTQFAEAFAMTLFNARLGQWMENPRYRDGARTHRIEKLVFWPAYLVREVIGSTDANSRLVHLSDGGHTGDNLGIVPLLKRRCAVIVACDAEADPDYTFGSLTEALRQVYIDDDIKVDLTLDAVEPDPSTGLSGSHCAVGRIRYPARPAADDRPALPAEIGWLVVLKSSLTGDELARIANYKRDNPVFPQQGTADQFFDDAQFESYRELGYHVAKVSLADVPVAAWHPETAGWDEYWSLQQ